MTFARDAAGKVQALDPRAPVWRVVRGADGRVVRCERAPKDMYMVSHFSTCVDRELFSRRPRRRKS